MDIPAKNFNYRPIEVVVNSLCNDYQMSFLFDNNPYLKISNVRNKIIENLPLKNKYKKIDLVRQNDTIILMDTVLINSLINTENVLRLTLIISEFTEYKLVYPLLPFYRKSINNPNNYLSSFYTIKANLLINCGVDPPLDCWQEFKLGRYNDFENLIKHIPRRNLIGLYMSKNCNSISVALAQNPLRAEILEFSNGEIKNTYFEENNKLFSKMHQQIICYHKSTFFTYYNRSDAPHAIIVNNSIQIYNLYTSELVKEHQIYLDKIDPFYDNHLVCMSKSNQKIAIYRNIIPDQNTSLSNQKYSSQLEVLSLLEDGNIESIIINHEFYNDGLNISFNYDATLIAFYEYTHNKVKNWIRVYNTTTGNQEYYCAGFIDFVVDIEFNSVGIMATALSDCTVKLWNGYECIMTISDSRLIPHYETAIGDIGYCGVIISIDFSPDNAFLAILYEDGNTNIYSIRDNCHFTRAVETQLAMSGFVKFLA